MSFLDQIFTKKKVIHIGVSISIDNVMDVVAIDKELKKVVDYKRASVEYNFQTKEINDYMTFSSTLKSILFDEMGLNPKNIELALTIPSILFAVTQLSSSLNDQNAINMALSTMAQDSYLFKRHEPVVAYQPYLGASKENTTYVYAAIQESVIEQLSEIISKELGIANYTINHPNSAIINGLIYTNKIEKQVNSGEVRNFVQISDNGFTLFSMEGTKIKEINDMPLPIKTFAPDEIYETMSLSLQNTLSIYPASALYVLSRTDLLSAQILLQNMDLRGDVGYCENNKFSQEILMDVDEGVASELANSISIEAIGAAVTDKTFPIDLCYLTSKDSSDETYGYINIFGKDIAVNELLFNKILAVVCVLLLVLFGGVWLLCNGVANYFDSQIADLNQQKAEIERKINEEKGQMEGNIDYIITNIAKNNLAAVQYFDAISKEIPDTIWLNNFYTDSSGGCAIKGVTSDINSLYDFFKNIRGYVEGSDINLTKLEYNDIDALLISNKNSTISFEITNPGYSNVTNMLASQLPFENKPDDSNKTDNGNNNKNNDGNSGSNNSDDNDIPPLPPLEPPTK